MPRPQQQQYMRRRHFISAHAQATSPTRNGLLLACEPCRRRKVACDHTLPVCQRCIARHAPERCVYIPEKRISRGLGRIINRLHSQTLSLSATTPLPVAAESDLGYMGPSSAVNFLHEAQELLESPSAGPNEAAAEGQILARDLEIGVEVLACIPDAATCKTLLTTYCSPVDSWIPAAAAHIADSLWSSFDLHLREPRSRQALEQMALCLCRTSCQTLEERQERGDAWLESFSGSNIRWEAVGILFARWATGTMQSHGGMPASNQKTWSTIKASVEDYVRCIKACLDLCRKEKGGNTLILYLLIKYTHLTSVVYGDASKSLRTSGAVED